MRLLAIALFLSSYALLVGQNIQPSIMIVPQKKQAERYVDLIENDRFLRVAIAKLDEVFLDRSYPTIDFIQHMETVNEDIFIESNNQKSYEQQLAENTNADIIVYFDAIYERSSDDKYVDIYLKAIDRQTSQVLVSKSQTSKVGSFDDGTTYLKNAIDLCADNFLMGLSKSFDRIKSKGRATKLSITFAENAGVDLHYEVNDDYDQLADVIESYVMSYAIDNYARCPIKVRTKFECDDIRLLHSKNDRPFTTNDFYKDLRKYLRKEYKLKSQGSVIGNSIRVTITGKEN